MRMLFLYVAKKISDGDQMPHWELLMGEYPKIMENAAVDDSVEKRVNTFNSTKLSENESIMENDTFRERAHLRVIGKMGKTCKSKSKQR